MVFMCLLGSLQNIFYVWLMFSFPDSIKVPIFLPLMQEIQYKISKINYEYCLRYNMSIYEQYFYL